MNFDDMYPSSWLRAADFPAARTLTITAITQEQVSPNEPPKNTVRFAGESKALVLNKTNATVMYGAWGGDTDTWIGKQIELFSMPVQGPNGPTTGIRCRVPAAVMKSEIPLPDDVPASVTDYTT